MSKITNALNQIWYEKNGDVILMGLTRSFLDTLDECLHIIPTSGVSVKEKSPLFTVETNDCLVSILSPVSGSFLSWNDRATNFPDKLTESDVIIRLSSKEVAPAPSPPEYVPTAPPPPRRLFDSAGVRDVAGEQRLAQLRTPTNTPATVLAEDWRRRMVTGTTGTTPVDMQAIRAQIEHSRWDMGAIRQAGTAISRVRLDHFDDPDGTVPEPTQPARHVGQF